VDSPTQIIWGVIFGSICLGFFIYGKKQQVAMPMICGLGLMVYPYFVSNTLLLVVLGLMLCVLPYFIRW